MLRLGGFKAALGFLLIAAVARADIGPLRYDFEKDDVGKAPADWVLTTRGYRAEVVKGGARRPTMCPDSGSRGCAERWGRYPASVD